MVPTLAYSTEGQGYGQEVQEVPRGGWGLCANGATGALNLCFPFCPLEPSAVKEGRGGSKAAPLVRTRSGPRSWRRFG